MAPDHELASDGWQTRKRQLLGLLAPHEAKAGVIWFMIFRRWAEGVHPEVLGMTRAWLIRRPNIEFAGSESNARLIPSGNILHNRCRDTSMIVPSRWCETRSPARPDSRLSAVQLLKQSVDPRDQRRSPAYSSLLTGPFQIYRQCPRPDLRIGHRWSDCRPSREIRDGPDRRCGSSCIDRIQGR